MPRELLILNRMNHSFFNLAYFVLATLSVLGMSNSAAAFETTLEGLCHDIHSERKQHDSLPATQEKTFSFSTRLKLHFSPEDFIGIRTSHVSIPSDAQKRPTLVFSMGPNIPAIPDDQTLYENARDDYLESLPTQRDLRALVNTHDEAECLDKARKLNMSSQQLEVYSKRIARNKLYTEEFQANQYRRFAETAADRFQDGQAISVATTDEILKRMADIPEGQYNLVFIFHADPTGRLYDYSRFVVEQDFFKMIKSKARTVAIFSCHPNAVSHYYSRAIRDFERSSIPVFQPDLKLDFKSIDAAPWALLEEFARQEKNLLGDYLSN
jgi:hypothetical protein